MKQEWEQCDLNTLLELYKKESKAFSMALSRGASWNELREKRIKIRTLNEYIQEISQEAEPQNSRRRDNKPPNESGKSV
jgi:hypothetical protein